VLPESDKKNTRENMHFFFLYSAMNGSQEKWVRNVHGFTEIGEVSLGILGANFLSNRKAWNSGRTSEFFTLDKITINYPPGFWSLLPRNTWW